MSDILDLLYGKEKSPDEFNFDLMQAPGMYNFLTPYDIQQLNNIATSAKYNGRIEKKYKAMDEIMLRRDCRRFSNGTNRLVYRVLECNQILFKIGFDSKGITNGPDEYKNQQFLKPFVTKIFEHSQCGTVASVERVIPLINREEYAMVGGEVFELLSTLIGKYVIEDIGTRWYKNIGIRNGWTRPIL